MMALNHGTYLGINIGPLHYSICTLSGAADINRGYIVVLISSTLRIKIYLSRKRGRRNNLRLFQKAKGVNIMKKKYQPALISLALFAGGCVGVAPQSPPISNTQAGSSATFAKRSVLGEPLAELENTTVQRGFSVDLIPRYGGESLRLGDIFDIDLQSSADAYAHLYLFQTSGTVVALTENMPVKAGQRVSFPPGGVKYRMRAHPPTGENTLLLLATKSPIQGTVRHNFQYLTEPKRIISTQLGAIAEIKNQLRNMPADSWSSTLQDITIYP